MTRAGEYVARPDSGESQDVDVEYNMGLDWMIAGIERLDGAAAE